MIAHELAHELLNHKERRAETTTRQRELEAESVAFAVLAHFGMRLESRFLPCHVRGDRGDAQGVASNDQWDRTPAHRSDPRSWSGSMQTSTLIDWKEQSSLRGKGMQAPGTPSGDSPVWTCWEISRHIQEVATGL